VVERSENFWTISRLYYGSGRYYRALWKANAARFPRIDELHINDVIVIPPVEELDPTYIDKHRVGSTSSQEIGRADNQTTEQDQFSSSSTSRDRRRPNTRTSQSSTVDQGDAIRVRRSSRSEAVLDLPVGDARSESGRGKRRVAVDPAETQGYDRQPEPLLASGPRSQVPKSHPVHMVRPYETLRSVARDTLGDARRASEILELNRDIIDDPNHLISGQLIQLPDDARPRRDSIDR
jgi:nucleoid-associated protein YgaU